MAQTMDEIVKLQIGGLTVQLASAIAENQALREENESLKLKLAEHVRKPDESKDSKSKEKV